MPEPPMLSVGVRVSVTAVLCQRASAPLAPVAGAVVSILTVTVLTVSSSCGVAGLVAHDPSAVAGVVGRRRHVPVVPVCQLPAPILY